MDDNAPTESATGHGVRITERAEIWQLAERFTQSLDRLGRQTWHQVSERAARLEMQREQCILAIDQQREETGGLDNIHLQAGSGGRLRYRYRHLVVDEAQELRPAHWKMLRATEAHHRSGALPARGTAGTLAALRRHDACRDSLDIFWHGTPNPFLAPLVAAVAG